MGVLSKVKFVCDYYKFCVIIVCNLRIIYVAYTQGVVSYMTVMDW